jgi:hypothetical protein
MHKLTAILNVIAWSGFWAFGYLALTADPSDTHRVMIALVLAVAGGAVGLWAWFRLVRHAEATGLARRPKFALPEHLRTSAEGEI